MIYEECKATHLNDASSRNNTPKHEAPLCARDWGINSNYFIMGPEGGGGGGGGGGPDPQDPLAGSALVLYKTFGDEVSMDKAFVPSVGYLQ